MAADPPGSDRGVPDAADEIAAALGEVAAALSTAGFRLPLPGGEDHETRRVELLIAIERHLLPRMESGGAPLVAALVGPTGSGKSTVVNALAEREVSTSGVLRPTTTRPVIWAHRDHAARYWQEFVGTVERHVGTDVEIVLGDAELLRGVTLVDAPPFEAPDWGGPSPDQVFALADLCILVISATRYADAEAWSAVRTARRRGLPALVVVNRLPPEDAAAVLSHYADMLAGEGLLAAADPTLLFPIMEQPGGPNRLPPAAVASLRRELAQLADGRLSGAMIRQARRGAVEDVAARAEALSGAFAAESEAGHRLLDIVEAAYERQAARLAAEFAEGRFAYLAGAPWPSACEQLAGVVTRLAGLAAQEAAVGWEADGVGKLLLAGAGGSELWRHGPGTRDLAERKLVGWSGDVEQLAAELPRRRRLGRRKRRKVGGMLRNAALDPAGPTPAELVLCFGAEQAELLLRWSQPTLVGDLRAALAVDAARFAALVGEPSALEMVPDLLTEAARRLLSAAKGLPG